MIPWHVVHGMNGAIQFDKAFYIGEQDGLPSINVIQVQRLSLANLNNELIQP